MEEEENKEENQIDITVDDIRKNKDYQNKIRKYYLHRYGPQYSGLKERDNEKLVDDFFAAMESGDLDSIESMFHDDVSMTDHGNGMTSDGVEANMNDVRNWKNTFSDMNI